ALKEKAPSLEVWFGRGHPMAAGAPFGVASSLIRDAAHVAADTPHEAQRQKLRARAGRHLRAEDAGRVAAFLGEVAGAPFPEEDGVVMRAPRRDRGLMCDHMRRAWETLVAAECPHQPLLVVIE